MAILAWLAGLAALVGTGAAQDDTEHIWSSVSYIFGGEHTPILGNNPTLTPAGAQQLYAQGAMFRTRYFNESIAQGGDSPVAVRAPILGIERYAIDNTQLNIISTTDESTVASTLAFMQGLYPPRNLSFPKNVGGSNIAVLANGSIQDYPLSGYQYPNLQIPSTLDLNVIWIGGQTICSQYRNSTFQMKNDPSIQSIYNNTLSFYQTIAQKLSTPLIPAKDATFDNAFDIYDYAAYMYNHDNATRSKITAVDLAMLGELANTHERDQNGNVSASGLQQGDMIRAISGRMLGGKIINTLASNIDNNGTTSKLNVMFGSHEPFVAFFALSGLIDGPSKGDFDALPNPGAALIFELYSIGGNTSVYPQTDQLWVRFLYRNSSLPTAAFVPYPLFGNGNEELKIRWTDFKIAMGTFSIVGPSEWCQICDSAALFCIALDSNQGGGSSGAGSGSGSATSSNSLISPAVAGVIGAAVTLAIIGLASALAIVLGRIRFYRADGSHPRNSTLGGFKGAEKMASDTDLAYAKNGGRHERTGSWELRNGGKGGAGAGSAGQGGDAVMPSEGAGAAVGAKTAAVTTTEHFGLDMRGRARDEDAISEIGQTPVRPAESF